MLHQKALDDVKTTIAKDVVLVCPDFKRCLRYTLMPCLNNFTQGNQQLAIFNKKLSATQQQYSATKLELLAITLKSSRACYGDKG